MRAPAPALPQAPTRLTAFDVLRGVFIMLIALQHLLGNLAPADLSLPGARFLRAAVSGTVGFVTLSGMVAGYRLALRDGRPRRLVARYRKHALTLIVLAHPIILMAIYGWKRASGEPADLVFRTYFVTDTLAIIFLLVVPLVARVRAWTCLLLAAVLMLAGRTLYVLHPASAGLGLLLNDILSGVDPAPQRHLLYEDYSVLAMSGMFLVGAWLGKQFAGAHQSGQLRALSFRYFRWAPALLLISVVLLGEWVSLRRGPQHAYLRTFLYPDYEFSTYPIYLATVVAVLGWMFLRGVPRSLEGFFAVLGRRSLFCFIAQYFVMQTLPLLLGWRNHMSGPGIALYLVVGILVLNLIARGYERLLGMLRGGGPPAGGPVVGTA